jgi:hypothetical protein
MNKKCLMPFVNVNLTPNGGQGFCNPTWHNHPKLSGDSIKEKFYSPEAELIRDSIDDGSYKYCKDSCPWLQTNREGGSSIYFSELKIEPTPMSLDLCRDRSCNLACPTCRDDFITDQVESFDEVNEIKDSIVFISTSGVGDPLYSKPTREYLKSINTMKYPSLKNVQIHTNAMLLKKHWSDISHLHPQLSISIDAADKQTYDVVRRGGNWDLLIENMKFLNEQKFGELWLWFVVQKENYTQIVKFFDLMEGIFTKKDPMYRFFRVENWGQSKFEEQLKVDNSIIVSQKTELQDHIKSGKIVWNL